MNIQNLINSIATSMTNVANSRTADSVQQTETAKDTPAAQQQTGAADQVKLSSHDNVNALLKEMATRFATSQRAFENMPASLRNEIRQLLSERATLFDMSGGLANLVQGQKDVFNNLNRLADTLTNLAKFLAGSGQADEGETNLQLQQNANGQPLTKEAVFEQMNAKLLQELIDHIGKNQQPEGKTQNTEAKATEQGKPLPEQVQKEAGKQAEPTVINRENAGNGSQVNQTANNQQKEVLEHLKSLQEQMQGKEQAAKGQQIVRNDSSNLFKDATFVKGLAENVGKENFEQLLNNLKAAQQSAKTAEDAPAQRTGTENTLLQLAKQILPGQNLPANVTPQQVEELVKNLKTFTSLLQQNAADNPELAKALQTLSKNPALLSMEEKSMLHSLVAQLVKEVFKGKDELGILERALNKLAGKERMFLDKQTSDLQIFNRLLKNADSLQHSRQQVERWAEALKELASGMAKTSGFNADRSSQHLHSSFVFNLATDGQDKNSPVYINIYHEKEDNTPGSAKSAETWLRVKVEPEFLGEVTAIFHLYQESLLDVKVIFANDDAIEEFNRFLPNIEEALQNTNMQLNSLLVI